MYVFIQLIRDNQILNGQSSKKGSIQARRRTYLWGYNVKYDKGYPGKKQ